MNQYFQRGQAAIQAKNIKEALECFSRALTEDPKNPQILATLGQCLCWDGQRDKGLEYLHQSGDRLLKKAKKSKDVEQAVMLVEQLHYWKDYHGALLLAKNIIKVNNKYVKAFHLMALTCSRLNKPKQGLIAAKQGLRLVPDDTALNLLTAELETADKQYKNAKQRLQKLLKQIVLSPEDKYRGHKELAKVLDKLGEYEQVFAHLHASTLAAKSIPLVQQQNFNLVPDKITRYSDGFSTALLSRWKQNIISMDRVAPIFVMGFLRSGTTLTQEVLDAHPDTFVADEESFISGLREELDRISEGKGSLTEQLKHIDSSQLEQLRAFYWHKVDSRFGQSVEGKVFIDKTTMNTIDLGLISSIFPDGKVVFVGRDPRDICLSCIMQIMEPTPSTVQLLDWKGTANFYALIMNWWRLMKNQMSIDFIEFRYEDAIADFEGTYGKVFGFLNLSWDAKVIDFHKAAAKKYISTPSFSQVSQPLYSSSVARWRHYEKEFAPVMEVLQPFIDEYGYE